MNTKVKYQILIQFNSGIVYRNNYDDKTTANKQYNLMQKSMREKSVLYSPEVSIDFGKVELIEFNELNEMEEA